MGCILWGYRYTPVRNPCFSQASCWMSSSSRASIPRRTGPIQGDIHMEDQTVGVGYDYHNVPLDLFPGIRVFHGEFQQLVFIGRRSEAWRPCGLQKLIEQIEEELSIYPSF